MKILQVIPVFSDPFGGPVTLVRSISKELAKHHEVTVYTTTALDPKHDFKAREEIVDGYKVVYFERTLKSLSYIDFFGQLNFSHDMLKAVKNNLKLFDVVHVHSYQQFPDILINYYSKKFGVPYILQPHGSIPLIGKRYRKIIYNSIFGLRVLNNSSKVIGLSEVEAEQLLAVGISKAKIEIIPNTIDPKDFDLGASDLFKKKYRIDKSKKIILYLGRIHKTKGLGLLVSAFGALSNELCFKELLLVIVGPDDGFKSELESLVNSLGISSSVLFTGFISNTDKINALRDASVFVTPSFLGFPMTFLESCAVGTPIITTNRFDTLEWIDKNVGYVISPTVHNLRQAIFKIITNQELQKTFSANCKQVMESTFSIEKVVRKLENVYRNVAIKSSFE